jgi:type IV pilus assembly protein PilE
MTGVMTMRRTRGFSLIELMIVLAIIAVLAAIAVPMWGRYTYRSRRVDGQNLLMSVAQAEERYYTDHNTYPLTATSLGFSIIDPTSANGYYVLESITLPSSASAGQGYTATAEPQGAQVGDDCGKLSIDNTGSKAYSGNTDNGNCW